MSKNMINEWKQPIDTSKLKEKQNYNLEEIYDHAHSELSLQQSKRDQVMTIYLALASFLLPFALGEEMIAMRLKGAIFIVLCIIGVLFAHIAVRYREYKEVYWLCCQTITVLLSFKPEELNKGVVQSTFYHCLNKKGKRYLVPKNDDLVFNRKLFVRKNIFSSETLYYTIISLMASFVGGLGLALLVGTHLWLSVTVGIISGALILLWLLSVYFKALIRVYAVLEERADVSAEARDKAFNNVFSKAWFLHFYCDN